MLDTSGLPIAKKILIYSTMPSGTTLVPPSEGPSSITLPTGAETIFGPTGIAVDPSTHEIEVMGETKATPKHEIFERYTLSRFTDGSGAQWAKEDFNIG